MSENKHLTLPDLPWKVRITIATLTFVIDVCRRSNGTINRLLANLFDFKSSPLKNPINGLKSSDITVDPSRNLWFRLYTPTTTSSDVTLPIIIYFHGGGFALLASNSKPYDDFCQRLARESPAIVISVNFRLSPEHKYPSQYEDGFDVLKFIDAEPSLFHHPNINDSLKQCFLAGDSAGGNVAHHVALKACEYEFSKVRVAGIISLQPFFGGEERLESETELVGAPLLNLERTDWMWKTFLPQGSDRDHGAVNVFGPNSIDLSAVKKFPATIVFVGGFDPLKSWQKRYYEGLKSCGKEAYMIEYPNAIHFFYALPELPESSLMIKEVRNFLQKQCNASDY